MNYCYYKYIQIREMQKWGGGRGVKKEVYTKLNVSCHVNFNGDLLQQEFLLLDIILSKMDMK